MIFERSMPSARIFAFMSTSMRSVCCGAAETPMVRPKARQAPRNLYDMGWIIHSLARALVPSLVRDELAVLGDAERVQLVEALVQRRRDEALGAGEDRDFRH